MTANPCRTLESRWHAEIPISAAMGIRVHHFDGRQLDVTADLQPNLNVHGTAFGGSLFSVAALCGWGQVHLQLDAAGLEGSIVFVEGRIRCLQPVRDAMLARCIWHPEAAEQLVALRQNGRARCHLDVQIESAGALAADFSGEYAVRLPAI